MPNTTEKSDGGAIRIALASLPLFLAIGITAYRVVDAQRPHNARQALKQKRTALAHQMADRLTRESIRISKDGHTPAEQDKEMTAAEISALNDFNKVLRSGFTIPYPAR
jgi:hypothetical protein